MKIDIKLHRNEKKLFFEFMRYKSINCFDDSNFSLDCGIHNVPFSNFNKICNRCSDQSCKFSFKYLSYLHQNLEALKKKLFVFENGVLKCWKPLQSILPPSPILSYDLVQQGDINQSSSSMKPVCGNYS